MDIVLKDDPLVLGSYEALVLKDQANVKCWRLLEEAGIVRHPVEDN